MDHSERQGILRALVEHIDNGTTADAGGIMRLPMSDYTCPLLLVEEQDAFLSERTVADGSLIPAAESQYLLVGQCNRCADTHGAGMARVGFVHTQTSVGIGGVWSCPRDAARGVALPVLSTHGPTETMAACWRSTRVEHFGDVSSTGLPLIELPSAEMHGTLWVRPSPGDPLVEDECLAGLQNDLVHWKLSEHPQCRPASH